MGERERERERKNGREGEREGEESLRALCGAAVPCVSCDIMSIIPLFHGVLLSSFSALLCFSPPLLSSSPSPPLPLLFLSLSPPPPLLSSSSPSPLLLLS